MKDKFNNYKSILYGQYRKVKDLVPNELGRKIYVILKYSILFITMLLIPILFTLFSTLMGAGIVSSVVYYSIFYSIWSIFIVDLILLFFFLEYRDK